MCNWQVVGVQVEQNRCKVDSIQVAYSHIISDTCGPRLPWPPTIFGAWKPQSRGGVDARSHLSFYVQRDTLESEMAELDARQQQLDAKVMKLNKQVILMLTYCYVFVAMIQCNTFNMLGS